MSTSAAPSVTRGEITLQPSYFTSSLYVQPLREDISLLVQTFTQQYLQGDRTQPFALFKKIWSEQGWIWLHFKVFDGRSRERFIGVTLRLFAERALTAEDPLTRVTVLFGMYTFFSTQPSTSLPPVHSLKHIALPLDIFQSIVGIPEALSTPELLQLRPYATHVLSKLSDAQAFHILPESSLRSQNPAVLPREHFVTDDTEAASVLGQPAESSGTTGKPAKKKGRPSKRDKAKKTKDAVAGLDRWLEKNTFTYPLPPAEEFSDISVPRTTHTLIAHPPVATHSSYALQKADLLDKLMGPSDMLNVDAGAGLAGPSQGKEVVARANEAVLTRLRRIDEMAAEKGLEVGGEGGDMTGLPRVGKAVEELREGKSKGGILSLLEGAGFKAGGESQWGDVQ